MLNAPVQTDRLQRMVAVADADKKAFEKLARLFMEFFSEGYRRSEVLEILKGMKYSGGGEPDVVEACKRFNKKVDQWAWYAALRETTLDQVLSASHKKQILESLEKNPPAFTVDNLKATVGDMAADAYRLFAEGVTDVLAELDSDYKTNRSLALKRKIIIKWLRSGYSSYERQDKIRDLQRACRIVNGQTPIPDSADDILRDFKSYGDEPQDMETEHLRLRIFKNGNAHLWFKSEDTIRKLNRVIADFDGGKSLRTA